jgi:hypothetical protein
VPVTQPTLAVDRHRAQLAGVGWHREPLCRELIENNFEETSDERASTDPHTQLAVYAGNAPGAFCKGS